MFKQPDVFVFSMTLDHILETQFNFAVEINVTFDDKIYLENIFNNLLGKGISGYKIAENETTYLWNDKIETKKIIALQQSLMQNKQQQ